MKVPYHIAFKEERQEMAGPVESFLIAIFPAQRAWGEGQWHLGAQLSASGISERVG